MRTPLTLLSFLSLYIVPSAQSIWATSRVHMPVDFGLMMADRRAAGPLSLVTAFWKTVDQRHKQKEYKKRPPCRSSAVFPFLSQPPGPVSGSAHAWPLGRSVLSTHVPVPPPPGVPSGCHTREGGRVW